MWTALWTKSEVKRRSMEDEATSVWEAVARGVTHQVSNVVWRTTFSEVRAVDFEGNVGEPATYTWRLLGVATLFTSGPGFTPGETPIDPPTGGPVQESNATITFVGLIKRRVKIDLHPDLLVVPSSLQTSLGRIYQLFRCTAFDLTSDLRQE